MADIAGAAREGLLAMSVAAGLAVMAAMFDAEMSQVCGPRARTTRSGPRWATAPVAGRSPWVVAGWRWAGPGPAVLDGHEVPLTSGSAFRRRRHALTRVVLERMLAWVAT